METEKDYEEFLELLNKHDVKYCIVGAFALAFHAEPRYTKDIDIWVQASTENAEKLLLALDEFGFSSLNLNAEDFSTGGNIIQLGYEPVRIDIITSIQDLDFNEIWQNRVQGSYGRQTVNFIDRENLIKSKKISNRPQDKADLARLQEYDPQWAKVEDAPDLMHQGRSRSRLLRVLDNNEDGVSLAFPTGKQNGIF